MKFFAKRQNKINTCSIWISFPKTVMYWHMLLLGAFVFMLLMMLFVFVIFTRIDGTELYARKVDAEASLLKADELKEVVQKYKDKQEKFGLLVK